MTESVAVAGEPARPRRTVGQVTAPLVGNWPAGAYRQLVLDAPDVADLARPGQFVACAVGGPTSGALLRRSFSIHRVDAEEGLVEIVVSAVGPGTQWLTRLAPGASVAVVGPLGRPFPVPTEATSCVLVGGGYGSAPLFWLAQRLKDKGCHVELVLGAADEERLFGVELAQQAIEAGGLDALHVTTDDGSLGTQGWVSDVLPEVLTRSGAAVAYACGPMGMLRSVSTIAAEHGAVAQVAVEEAMACGVGVCMTCVMPVIGKDGATRMTRSCVEGPVFRGDAVRWDFIDAAGAQVPPDCIGAPSAQGAGH